MLTMTTKADASGAYFATLAISESGSWEIRLLVWNALHNIYGVRTMARPRRNAMIAELERRTREYFEDQDHTPLDYVAAWTERGRTLTALAQSVTEAVNGSKDLKPGQFEISRHQIDQYLRELAGGAQVTELLKQARKAGAHGLVEEGIQALDNGSDERDTANANRLRLEARERLAAVWDRESFAKSGNNVNVSLSFASLHLAALQHAAPERVTARLADAQSDERTADDVEIVSEPA